VARARNGRVGGKPARIALVSTVNRRRTPLTVLLMAAQGRRRSWLVEVIAGSPNRALEGGVILHSLRLSG
jgi:hypothetical protein